MFQNTKPIRSGGITDNTKPLIIPSGSDTFESIGSAPVTNDGSNSQSLGFRLWRDNWNSLFPQTEKEKHEDTFMEEAIKYPEPSIDAMRVEKEKILERYKRESTSRARANVFVSSTASPSAQYERSIAKQTRA